MAFEIKPFLQDKHIVLVGCGREGISTYRFIRSLLPGLPLHIADLDENLVSKFPEFQNDPHLSLTLGKEYLSCLDAFDLIIKTPGVTFKDLAVQPSADKISSQTDLFLRMFGHQVTGITGTKGKSTTSSLIRHIIGKQTGNTVLVGNIGLPPFDMLSQIDSQTRIVCELSSHQLQYITVAPRISILLNLYEEHLDHYNSYLEYQLSKLNIARRQQPGDHFIYNDDDLQIRNLMAQYPLPGTLHPFSASRPVNSGAFISNDYIQLSLDQEHPFYPLTAPRHLPGAHNLNNIMAATLACLLNDIEPRHILEGISDFKGLEHRIEFVGIFHGIKYYNDSISTIPQATIAAVETLRDVDTLILGGFDRGIDYSVLIDYLTHSPIQNLIFVGLAGERMLRLLIDAGANNRQLFRADDYDQVAQIAREHTRPGAICLLSPAAASYDQFKNFEERGRIFKEKVSH